MRSGGAGLNLAYGKSAIAGIWGTPICSLSDKPEQAHPAGVTGDLTNYTVLEEISVTTPAFTLFDAMVAYETPEYRWQLTAQNLEDEYFVTACGAMRGDCFVGQGRTITTSFFYKF